MIQVPAPDIPRVVVSTGPSLEPIMVAIIVMFTVIGAVKLLLPLVRALARRLEGGHVAPELRDELEELRARAMEIDSMRERVGELEERVDFAERLLAARVERSALPGGPEH